MDRGGGGGGGSVAYASRNGRQDYDDRHADNGGYHGYNNHSNDLNGGGYRRNAGPGYNNGPSGASGAGGGYGSGRSGANWGQFNGSNGSGRQRNENSQYPDRSSNMASGSSVHGGSPPNSHGFDGHSRGEHRNAFGDPSSYRGHGNNNNDASDPSESLKAYQQSKSSDPYAVGLRSSAAFFHETYDKLERPGGFADSTSGTQYTLTVIKTYREIATQTTDDQISGSQDSSWNGVRIISTGKQQPPPQHPQQPQPQHPQQHQNQYQQQQQQQQQQRSAQTYPKTPLAPAVVNPPRSTATVASLLNAVLTPTQSPIVSSATATKPNASGSYGSSNPYSSDERRSYGMAGSGGATGGSSGYKSGDHTPAAPNTYQKPPSAIASTANRPLASSDNSSWMGAPNSDTRRNTTTTHQDNTRDEAVKKTDTWGAPPPPTAASAKTADHWSHPATASSAKADSWGQPAVTSSSTANSGLSGWGNSTQGKAVSDLVDWSTGLVSEFPTEAKPTFMAVTERWDKMSKYDPSYIARQDINNRQKAHQQQQEQQQEQQSQLQQQQQHSNSDSDDGEQAPGRAQEKRDVVQEHSESDPWLNDGNAKLSDWGSSEAGESQMIFVDRDDASSQGQPVHVGELQHHKGPARHQNDDDGHYPGTGASQDRRAMTSEERFNNSYSRPPGGGGGMGGGPSGRYNSNSKGGPGSRYGDSSSSSGGGGGGHGYERAQRHGPMTVTPSSTVSLTGRRYFNNTMDRDSAIGAWSVASQHSSSKPGPGQGVPPSGTSASLPRSNAVGGSPVARSPGSTKGGGGRLALATVSDFGSFFQAAATFTPPPPRTRQGNHMRRGSESESVTTRHSSPSRSRESSRSRPPHSGAGLEHTEEEPDGAEGTVERDSVASGHGQVDDDEDLIKDEEIAPVNIPGTVAGAADDEDKGEKQQETVDDDRKVAVRTNSNSSRTSSQAMEENLLNFQMQKQAVVSSGGNSGGVKEKEEEQEETKKVEDVVECPGTIDVEKVVVGSTLSSPEANSDGE